MREPTYRQALIHSWQLVWRNKTLWILGICAMVLGQWGLGDFIGQMNLFVEEGFSLPPGIDKTMSVLAAFNFDSITAGFLSLWFFILVALFIGAVIFVAVVSRGALIASASEWYYDRKHLPLKIAWREGVRNFGPLFTLVLINKLLQTTFVLAFVNFLVMAIAWNSMLFNFLAVVVFWLAFFFILILEAVTIYSSCYLVLERVWIGKAIKQGWNLFKHHVMVSLELGVLLALLSLVLFVFLSVSSIAVLIPFLALWLIAGFSGWYVLITVGLILATALFVLIAIVAGGIFSAFNTSAWVYLFMKMHHEGIFSRVVHHLKSWLNIR